MIERRPGAIRSPARFRASVLGSARRGARSARDGFPTPGRLRAELVPSISRGVGAVPDGMAGSVLAGVDPMFGLYASVVGPIVGGVLQSSQLVVVTTTSAMAIAASNSLDGLSGQARADTLFLLIAIIGVFQVAAAVARLGRLTGFVSHSVMVGFLSGIGTLIVLGQLGNLTGFHSDRPDRLGQALDLLIHPRSIDPATFAVGLVALVLTVWLPKTRLRAFGLLVALVVPSALAYGLGLSSVALVRDVGNVTRGLPLPALPSLSLITVDLITGAAAVAVIGLVQGAGVAQSVRNPDGSRADTNRDFAAQGVANLVASLFQGLPVGGSTGQTALNALVGAGSRWTSVLSGIWVAVILLLIPNLIGLVAMPALAALLVVAGFRTINVAEARSIWMTGPQSRVAIVATYLSTIFLPIQAAVAIGATLSAIFYLNDSSTDIDIREVVELPDGRFEERHPPRHLESGRVIVLAIYGSLFYAGARTLERRLPQPGGASRPVVVLRLRGRTSVGSTLIDVLAAYAVSLAAAGGRLYLSGVDERVRRQIRKSQKLDEEGPVRIFGASRVIGESTAAARADAEAWLVSAGYGDEDAS